MKAGEFCSREVVVVGPDETLASAARLMAEQHVGCLVVVLMQGEARVPVGIMTDRDIVVRAVVSERAPSGLCVSDVASSDLLTVGESADLDDVVQQMRARGVRRVPVVDAQRRLVGVISYDEVVEWIAEELSNLTRLMLRERQHERAKAR